MKIKKRLVRVNVPLPKSDNAVKTSFLIFLKLNSIAVKGLEIIKFTWKAWLLIEFYPTL